MNSSFAGSINPSLDYDYSPHKIQKIEIKQALLRTHSQKYSIIQSIRTKIQERIRKKKWNLHLIELQEKQLETKRFQLIADPIYDSSLPETTKQYLITFIMKYTSFMQIIQPENKKLIPWNIAVTIIIMYYYFEIGLVLLFGQVVWEAELQYWWSYLFNYISIVMLICDMILTLNRGYYQKGILISDRVKIYKNYFGIQLAIDIISVIILALTFFSGNYYLNYVKILFLLKLSNLNLIDYTFQRILQFDPIRNAIYLITRLLVVMIMFCHYMGGIFYYIDVYVYTNNYYGPNTPSMCWIYNSVAYQQMILELPWSLQYLYTMYWAIATITTIAYGDITPMNPLETAYVIVSLLFSAISFAYIINNILEIIFEVRNSQNVYIKSLASLNEYMKKKLINNRLQSKIRGYFEFLWNEEGQRFRNIEIEMMQKLPRKLKDELLQQVYKKFLSDLLIYRLFPIQIVPQIVDLIDQYRSSKGQILWNPQTEQTPIARYLVNGQVTLFINTLKIKSLKEGSFGILEFFKDSKKGMLAKTTCDSMIYFLQRQKFVNLVLQNPVYTEIFRYIVDRLNQGLIATTLGIYCFICGEENHLCKNCPYSHYLKNIYEIIKNENKKKQSNMKYKRHRSKQILLNPKKLAEQLSIFIKKKTDFDYFEEIEHIDQHREELLNDDFNNNDAFNEIEDHLMHTDKILKFFKERILKNFGYQLIELDVRRDYKVYFPEFNFTNRQKYFAKKNIQYDNKVYQFDE